MTVDTELPYVHSLESLASGILEKAEPKSDEEYFKATFAISAALDSISRHPYDQSQIRRTPDIYTTVVISAFKNDPFGKEIVAWLLQNDDSPTLRILTTLDENHKRQILYGVVQNEIRLRTEELDRNERAGYFDGDIDEDKQIATVSQIASLNELKRKIRERASSTQVPERK